MLEDITDEQHLDILKCDGYRRLSVAVIYQSVLDRGRGSSDHRYESARHFLEDTDMRPWIDVVGIDREAFADYLTEDVTAGLAAHKGRPGGYAKRRVSNLLGSDTTKRSQKT